MRKPTLKQKKAFDNAVENGGVVSRAMIDAGYSPNTAKTPQKLTESKSWEELMEQHFPDSVLTKKIEEGLNATRVISAVRGTSANGGTTDFIDVPDYATQHKFVDTALKLKGKLIEKKDITSGGKPLPLLGGITNDNSNDSNEKTS